MTDANDRCPSTDLARDDPLTALLSGEGPRVWGPLLRAFLLPAVPLYWLGTALHRAVYALGIKRRKRLPVPVVCVGNLSAGGTGKTPMVISLALLGSRLGVRLAVVARGYKTRRNEGYNDEGKVIRIAVPDLGYIQDPDRYQGGLTAVGRYACDGILLDDGFSHRQLHRDLDIVLIDATRPFGWWEQFPRGLLREPPGALRRAHAAVITRANLVEPETLDRLRRRVARALGDGKPVCTAGHRPLGLRNVQVPVHDTSRFHLPSYLRGRRVFAVCGIGNPDAFTRSLTDLGAEVAGVQAYPDHHDYTFRELEACSERARALDADICVTTAKDAVKFPPHTADLRPPWHVLEVDLELADGRAELEALLARVWGGA